MNEVGGLNHPTAEEVLRGISLSKSASVFSLPRQIDEPKGGPVRPRQSLAEKTMVTYQYPRTNIFLDHLSKTVTGTILQRELRALNA
jgi:acyl-coenzyme A synthetase/AMP-(fatty) acid ligase